MITFPNKPAPVIKHFLDQNKQLVYKYLLTKINAAIKTNANSIDVFQHNNKVESIQKNEFKKTLNHAIAEFCKVEDYESAAIGKKLIDRLTINELINSTTSNEECNTLNQKSV